MIDFRVICIPVYSSARDRFHGCISNFVLFPSLRIQRATIPFPKIGKPKIFLFSSNNDFRKIYRDHTSRSCKLYGMQKQLPFSYNNKKWDSRTCWGLGKKEIKKLASYISTSERTSSESENLVASKSRAVIQFQKRPGFPLFTHN